MLLPAAREDTPLTTSEGTHIRIRHIKGGFRACSVVALGFCVRGAGRYLEQHHLSFFFSCVRSLAAKAPAPEERVLASVGEVV